ncbi:hypothetical protein GGR53DRAFT_104205 [Hypoxylon sp. FL1150]|nr:hypothetical protein GGR53DRAFT_104205 [Hypoxylon sp. FL1150]
MVSTRDTDPDGAADDSIPTNNPTAQGGIPNIPMPDLARFEQQPGPWHPPHQARRGGGQGNGRLNRPTRQRPLRPDDPRVIVEEFKREFEDDEPFPVAMESPDSKQVKTCSACGDEFPADHLQELDCKHYYCKDLCLEHLFMVAFESTPFRPVRCCNEISEQQLREMCFFLPDQLMAYSVKAEEARASVDKLYCHNPLCGAYIPQGTRNRRVGTCIRCHRKTCKSCRQKSHFGACDTTAQDADRQALEPVYRLAREEGWQACPKCYSLIERLDGCSHMNCECGQEFCYDCGQALDSDDGHACIGAR